MLWWIRISSGVLRVFKGWVPYDWKTDAPISRVQRGSPFPTFDGSDNPWLPGIAGFFTTDRNVAERFANLISKDGVVGTFDIKLGRVYEIDAQGKPAGIVQFEKTGLEFQDAVRSGQYDTIIIRNTSDEGDVIVGLNPDNITIIDPGVSSKV